MSESTTRQITPDDRLSDSTFAAILQIVMFDNTYEISEPGEDPRVNGALKEIQATYGGNLINMEFVSWYTPGLALWQKKARL